MYKKMLYLSLIVAVVGCGMTSPVAVEPPVVDSLPDVEKYVEVEPPVVDSLPDVEKYVEVVLGGFWPGVRQSGGERAVSAMQTRSEDIAEIIRTEILKLSEEDRDILLKDVNDLSQEDIEKMVKFSAAITPDILVIARQVL